MSLHCDDEAEGDDVRRYWGDMIIPRLAGAPHRRE
jgi:hypothetical protein